MSHFAVNSEVQKAVVNGVVVKKAFKPAEPTQEPVSEPLIPQSEIVNDQFIDAMDMNGGVIPIE